MKKLIYTLLAVSLIFSACKKEEDEPSNSDNNNAGDNNCNVVNFTDIDGNIYDVVSIGNQCWLKENLNVSTFSNGEQIPEITSGSQWATTSSPGWCYYENNIENGITYGKLYNAYALNDPRGIAPEGWRVPTPTDWEVLFDYLGGVDIAGKHMKVSGDGNFGQNNTGTNSSGFSALPAGRRVGNTGASNQGSFATGGQWANFAATEGSFYINNVDYIYILNWGGDENNGNSVRLIKE